MDEELDGQLWPPEKEKTWFFYATRGNGGSICFVETAQTAQDAFSEAVRRCSKDPSLPYVINRMNRI